MTVRASYDPRAGVGSSLSPHAGNRRAIDDVKRQGWREQGVLAIDVNDGRLRPEEQAVIQQLGDRLYGPRRPHPEGWRR